MMNYPSIRSIKYLVLSVACLCVAGVSQAQTLLSHYVLDGNTNDTGTIGANGTLSGTTSYVADAPGLLTSALDLSASGSNYMEANIGSSYSGLNQVTITLWINLRATAALNDRLVSNLEASTLDGFDVRFSNNTNPAAFGGLYNVNMTDSPAVSNNYSANQTWTFLAVTYDATLGSNQVKFYKGDESDSVTANGTGSQTGALDESALLRIGSTAASGSDRTPPAYFSDVRVYSGVLDLAALESARNSVLVPEPGTYALFAALAALGVVAIRRRAIRR